MTEEKQGSSLRRKTKNKREFSKNSVTKLSFASESTGLQSKRPHYGCRSTKFVLVTVLVRDTERRSLLRGSFVRSMSENTEADLSDRFSFDPRLGVCRVGVCLRVPVEQCG